MAFLTATPTSSSTSSTFHPLSKPKITKLPFPTTLTTSQSFPYIPFPISKPRPFVFASKSNDKNNTTTTTTNAIQRESSSKTKDPVGKDKQKVIEEEEEVEVEEELPWIQEKALDLVEFTGSVTQAIPGPRVGQSSLPWLLALPLAYAGVSFVIAFVKTVKKFSSPKAKRRRLVNKNSLLCKSIDELFLKGGGALQYLALESLAKQSGFSMEDILRKYIRYALNEKPFNAELVADLIKLRKASMLDDAQVAEVLNEISRRIVQDKGPVVMNLTGYTEKGFKRKLAVQALFGKIYYLSELPEFCRRDSSIVVKEIFGVTDEDAEKIRLHTLSEAGDVESLEKMIDVSDSEDTEEDLPTDP